MVGYENEVLMSEVGQVQAYKDRIDEMDGITLNLAQLEKTNARCRLRSPHQGSWNCRIVRSGACLALWVWRLLYVCMCIVCVTLCVLYVPCLSYLKTTSSYVRKCVISCHVTGYV